MSDQDPIRTIPITAIETLREGVKDADLDPCQIKPGALTGRLTFADLAGDSLTIARIAGHLRNRGPLSDTRFTLGLILQADGAMRQWSGETLTGDLGMAPAGQEHSSLYCGRCSYATLAVGLDDLHAALERKEIVIDERLLRQAAMYRPEPVAGTRMVQVANRIDRATIEHPAVLSASAAFQAMRDELLDAILAAMPGLRLLEPNRRIARNAPYRIVREAEDLLFSASHGPVRIPELCARLGISERSLHRAFQEELGLPPATYLRNRRLTRVRQQLLDPELAGLSITEIAVRTGFWELGRFAQQYRVLFGELPSETRRRGAATVLSGA